MSILAQNVCCAELSQFRRILQDVSSQFLLALGISMTAMKGQEHKEPARTYGQLCEDSYPDVTMHILYRVLRQKPYPFNELKTCDCCSACSNLDASNSGRYLENISFNSEFSPDGVFPGARYTALYMF